MAAKAAAKTWTIRCKIHKTTVLLYAEPATPLSTLKQNILTALSETHPIMHLQGPGVMYQIPEDIDEIKLAKPVEADGIIEWQRIDVDNEEAVSSKSKGKAVGVVNGKESKETVQNTGLTDGCFIAVAFRGMPDWDVVLPGQEPEDSAAFG